MATYTKTITEELAVLDRRSWSDLSYTWDDYVQDWDSYGEMPITHYQITLRTIWNELPFIPDVIIKMIKKPQAETLTMTETIVRKRRTSLIETLHLTETLSRLAIFSRTLLDTLSILEWDWTWDKMTQTWDDYAESWDNYGNSIWVRIITLKAVSDTLNLAETITKKAIKNLTDAISHSETMTRVIKLLRTETLAMTEYLAFQLNLSLRFQDTITLTENFLKLFKEFFIGAIGRIRNQNISGTIKQNTISGRISDAPGIVEGRIREIQPRGNIQNQDIIGKITQK